MHEVFKSTHLVGSHQLQGVMKMTDMTPLTLCTKACVEPISMHQVHFMLYMCAGDIYVPLLCTVCDTLVYTYSMLA